MQSKMIEIRRHAKRRKPESNLMTEGIRQARNASACDRDFALVVTSTLPRAVQTAVANAYATLQTIQLRHWLSRVEQGEAVLVVSHGGIAEAGIIGLLGDADVSSFGPSLDYCEGARIELDGESARRVELLRFEGENEYTALELGP